MIRLFTFVCFFLVLFTFSVEGETMKITSHKLEELLKEKSTEKKVKIINFWATWCAPCVKELPLFQEAASENKDIAFQLVSLDFPQQTKKVDALLAKKNITIESYHLDEVIQSETITRIHKDWEGSIPATIVLIGTEKMLYEKEFHEKDFQIFINSLKTK